MNNAAHNRNTTRRRVIKRGTIYYNQGRSSINCVIKNVSSRGAMIEVAKDIIPGSNIDLVLDNTVRFPGRVVWSEGNRYGVCTAA